MLRSTINMVDNKQFTVRIYSW